MKGIEELWRVGRKQGRKRPTRRATLNTRGRIARSGDRIGTGQPSCGLPLTVWAVDKGATCRCRIVRAKFACRTKNRARFDDGVGGVIQIVEAANELGMLQHDATLRGFLNDPVPIAGRDIAAIAPLANLDALFVNIGSHAFGIVIPDGVNRCKV